MYKAIFWYLTIPAAAGYFMKLYLDKKEEKTMQKLPYVSVRPVKWKVTLEK